jgi:predicted nucleic acid-binding protein
VARRDHERSQMTRGELLFGIKQRKTPEQQREEYKALFMKMDKDGSVRQDSLKFLT